MDHPVTNRLLVKLRPSNALSAAESRFRLEPLYEAPPAPEGSFGIAAAPRWFLADLPDGAASPWDLAHARIADQLGIAESDVLFAEPDQVASSVYRHQDDVPAGQPFAADDPCQANPQDGENRKALGPGFAWHLGDDFSQLGSARAAVDFTGLRTRIAHLDTGYFRDHETRPKNVLTHLERNFVTRDDDPAKAEDPNNYRLLFDNSGHGTGTLSILAGRPASAAPDIVLGGAPEADILPLRVADSVVLLRTSAFARALAYAVRQGCDVATMSMGGLPSRAWAEAVDAAYEAGLCLCAAAGNHVGLLPPRVLVYPARYSRVIAVCGVMADGRPYADLGGLALEGSHGPESAMEFALAAYTPNIPWAVFGCKTTVRLNGQGTSSATPQVAAAVALWFEKYKDRLPRNHQRVEAVRHALFSTAKQSDDRLHFGRGVLQAAAALAVAPVLGLPPSPRSKNTFAFLRVITGLGISGPTPREEMFNLELAQRWLLNPRLQELVPDPESLDALGRKRLEQVMEAVIEDREASLALRRHVAARFPVAAGGQVRRTEASQDILPDPTIQPTGPPPALVPPLYRRLRVYAVDPSFSNQLATAGSNEVTLRVRWEDLKRGPVGEYLRVEDPGGDPAKPHLSVDLDEPRLLAQDGWAPAEGNPQFHQQMVYAVAMTTIDHFENALGRPVLWRPRSRAGQKGDDPLFVRQLVIRPHALRQANAFYSPQEVALLFGWFEARRDTPGQQMPGSTVYSCLSHDIIAHETTHAILDGMQRRFNEPTNPDVLAFHEAFADIVALLQHFTLPAILDHEIQRTRGDIEAESILGSLAIQFGSAAGGHGALRNAIGRFENGNWKRFEPNPEDLRQRVTPHARGAVLVGAVFDAFLAIYKARTADLLRLSTGGTGILPNGAIHPDLVRRLSDEAGKAARHLLLMCIRAIDYLPPVDVTFFEFLRAVVTADFDLVRDDRFNYRVAFVEAFRRRGIYPLNLEDPAETLRTLSVDTLRWRGLGASDFEPPIWAGIQLHFQAIVEELKNYANRCLYLEDRKELFEETRRQSKALEAQLAAAFATDGYLAAALGLDPDLEFEVHDLRRATLPRPDGEPVPQVVVGLTQEREIPAEPTTGTPAFKFRGGSTLIVDLSLPAVKYRIEKNIRNTKRLERATAFVREAESDPLRRLYFALNRREPFAVLHALADE